MAAALIASPSVVAPFQGVDTTPFAFWARPVIKAQDGSLSCPGFEGKSYAKNVWDYVTFAANATGPSQAFVAEAPLEESRTPGICEVEVTKYRDVDKKKKKGSDGARLTVHGIEPAIVQIKITIWTPEQLRLLARLWPALFPKLGKGQPPVFGVVHPALVLHDINSLVFVKGTGPAPGSVVRSRIFTIEGIEYIPQPDAAKSVTKTVKAMDNTLSNSNKNPKPGDNSKNTDPLT